MSFGKVGIKFSNTWIMFELSLDKLSNALELYILNSFINKEKEILK